MEANRNTQSALKISERPYVVLGRKDGVLAEIKESKDPNWFGIALYLQNTGHLPALNVCVSTDVTPDPSIAPISRQPNPLMRQRGKSGIQRFYVVGNGCGSIPGDSAIPISFVKVSRGKPLTVSEAKQSRLWLGPLFNTAIRLESILVGFSIWITTLRSTLFVISAKLIAACCMGSIPKTLPTSSRKRTNSCHPAINPEIRKNDKRVLMITTRKNCEKAEIGSARGVLAIEDLRVLRLRRNLAYPWLRTKEEVHGCHHAASLRPYERCESVLFHQLTVRHPANLCHSRHSHPNRSKLADWALPQSFWAFRSFAFRALIYSFVFIGLLSTIGRDQIAGQFKFSFFFDHRVWA